VFPDDMVAWDEENATQEAKEFGETWIDPEQVPTLVCPVSVAGFIAVENVTEMLVLAMADAPSAGDVAATCGGGRQLPSPSHAPPGQVAPMGALAKPQAPSLHVRDRHAVSPPGH
jgi:hypothetical protein